MKTQIVVRRIFYAIAFWALIGLTVIPERKITGIYEYVYPDNTNGSAENHYIKLETINGMVSGMYYGTSDDFDEAREQYRVGFFKAKIVDLVLTDTTIAFKVRANSSDMFTKAITPFDNPSNNKLWPIGVRYNERTYSGKILGDSIIIQTKEFDPRVFVRRKP